MTDIYQANTYRNGIDIGNYQSVFRKKTERINWKKLASVDIDRVIQHNDVGVLRENIKHVAFCDLDAEMEIRGSDRTLAKMFKMAQLIIDYLLSSQEHLAALASESEERCASLIEEAENAKRKVQESEGYIGDLKRECHRRKKLILAQQQIMDSGPETYHRCPYCEKAFLNGSFLQAHLEKRHSGMYIRSMYQIDSRRAESPRRDNKHDFHSSSEKRIEELVRQFSEQQRHPGEKSDEIERMRQMMEDMMRQQRDEMEGVIHDLEQRLREAKRHENKSRSYLGDMIDDRDDNLAQKAGEEAIKKAVRDKQKMKKAFKPYDTNKDDYIKHKRQYNQETEAYIKPKANSRQNSPVRIKSPIRNKSPPRNKSPIRHKSPELRFQPVSVHDSVDAISKTSEFSNFDRMWEMNEPYRLQAREEVVNMLAEHLEHHGIKRTATGIPDTILKEKLNVTDMEQRQLSVKYIDFGEIRQRLVAEVEAEAAEKLRNRDNPVKRNISPVQFKGPPPKMPQKNNDYGKGTDFLSTDSDSEEISAAYHGKDKRDKLRSEAMQQHQSKYDEQMNANLQSPKRPSAQTNNARASSDLSNSLDSSKWGPSENQVTSVPHAGNTHKSAPTNKSSDHDNFTDSFDET